MAVAFDAAGTSGTTFDVSTSTLTFNHTVGSLTNGILMAFPGSEAVASPVTASGITYAGSSLTQVTSALSSGTSAGGLIALTTDAWRKLAPASGSNNVVVTFGGVALVVAHSGSFQGVDQTTPTGTPALAGSNSGGGTSTGTLDASAVSGDAQCGALMITSAGGANVTPSQTQIAESNETTQDDGTYNSQYRLGAGGYAWTIPSGNDGWRGNGVRLIQVSAASGVGPLIHGYLSRSHLAKGRIVLQKLSSRYVVNDSRIQVAA